MQASNKCSERSQVRSQIYPTVPKEMDTVKLFAAFRAALFIAVAFLSATVSFSQGKKAIKAAPSVYKATIEGLVRDVACPIQNHAATATHFDLDCAMACAKSGSPLIILTRSGDIYFPISDQMPDPSQREKMMPFIGKYVRVTGTVYRRNGTRAIVIKEITEMKGIKPSTKAGGS